MDIFSNFENLCLFLRWKQSKTSRGFHKQSILYINICFKKHVEENLFNLMHAK